MASSLRSTLSLLHNFANSTAALCKLPLKDIAQASLTIAAEICVFTNTNIIVEEL